MRPEDIDYVELIGGGSRIPKLQSIIQEIIQD
jgi:molecular chaperone DnaK (HSP70)